MLTHNLRRFGRRQSAGLTLIELLLVIAVLGILLGVILPSGDPTLHERLRATARVVATDLAYGRSLAVAYNSTYRISFDNQGCRYVLRHSGTNPALNTLPKSPFRAPGDPPDQHIVDLNVLPCSGGSVQFAATAQVAGSYQPVTELEFGALGQTSRANPTIVWLAAGRGAQARYISVTVNPVTGLAELGAESGSLPAGVTIPGY